MFDGQYNKYANDEQFYHEMMSYMEMEQEMSEADINKMERDFDKSLTEQDLIVAKVASNNADYKPEKTGA